MSMKRTIQCSVEGCGTQHTEEKSGAGFLGWGMLSGKCDDETGETEFHLCPEHLNDTFKYLTKERY